MHIAQTILAQLGGGRFLTMTGAKNIVIDGRVVQFNIGAGAVNGCNRVRVELTPDDLYTMTFYRVRSLKFAVLAEVTGVYAEDLQATFRAYTGLDTHL